MSENKPLLKENIINQIKKIENINIFLDKNYINWNNEKYMKMYDWMSRWYDLVETIIWRILHWNSVKKLRTDLMSKLEWKDNISILYVSIWTWTDLKYIPEKIDKTKLEITWIDISLWMLKKCYNNFSKKLNLSLFQCCAENLPFKDEQFDIVFHVWWINFFNDKKLAIKEMLRVAKKWTKILIADETSDYIDKQYKKSSLSKKYFENQTFDLKDIDESIPKDIFELKKEFLWKNNFYCITFRK